MSDQEKFVERTMALLKTDGGRAEASMALIEEYATTTPAEFTASIKTLASATQKSPIGDRFIAMPNEKEISQIELTTTAFLGQDKLLFQAPEAPGMPLKNAQHEQLARSFQAVEELVYTPWGPMFERGLPYLRQAADKLVSETSKMDKPTAYKVLKRARELDEMNENGGALNIVFADVDGDGKREELSNLTFNYINTNGRNKWAETIDVYDPPTIREGDKK